MPGAGVGRLRRLLWCAPRARGIPAHEVVNTVHLYKYRPYAPGGSKLSFITEYVYSFLATARLTLKARRRGRFAVMQACNPPDIFWPIALALRAVDRTRFVFDHHDLCPELFQSRFPDGPALPYRGLRALERRTHRTADHVISTNDSYRDIAIAQKRQGTRGRYSRPHRPRPGKLKRGARRPGAKAAAGSSSPRTSASWARRTASTSWCGRPTSWCTRCGREDIAFTVIGSGDCFDELVALRDELELNGHVEFTGRAPDDLVKRIPLHRGRRAVA